MLSIIQLIIIKIIKLVTKCNGGVVIKNNTVWQGQLDGNSYSPACSLTIRPNSISKSRPLAAYDKDSEYATYRHHNEYENDEDEEYEHYEEACKKKAPPICQIRYRTFLQNNQNTFLVVIV